MPAFSSSTLAKGKVSIVNVWASWCISCRAEHRFLDRLAKRSGIDIYGLNYKDTASAGRKFLARFGNPYEAVGMDRRGRVGIDFGVYGVPKPLSWMARASFATKSLVPSMRRSLRANCCPPSKKHRLYQVSRPMRRGNTPLHY